MSDGGESPSSVGVPRDSDWRWRQRVPPGACRSSCSIEMGNGPPTRPPGCRAGTGSRPLGLEVDVSDIGSLEGAADQVSQRFGGADLVVSNVGVQLFGAVERFTDDEWRWLLDVNVIGSARMARTFVPLLRRSSHGRLAFTTSSSVLDPASRLGAYQASKFAVWGLAETLRLELGSDGIGVSVIFPSGMASRHLETSEAAQPEHVRRPIGEREDFAVHGREQPLDGPGRGHAGRGRGRRGRGAPGRRALRHHPRGSGRRRGQPIRQPPAGRGSSPLRKTSA